MTIVFFDEFDAYETFVSCIEHTGDKEYCKKAIELLIEAQARREFTYGDKVRFHVVLPHHVEYKHFAMATYKERRAVTLFMDGGSFILALLYERGPDGEFRLKSADWLTAETKALKNPHPLTFFRQHL